MLDLIIDDNLKASDYKFYIAERPSIPTTEMNYNVYSVDGRDGDLYEEIGYKDRSFKIEFNALEESNIKPFLRKFKGILLTAEKIRLTDDDCYMEVKQVKIGDADNEVEYYGYFEASFIVSPFDYEDTSDVVTLTAASNLTNPGTYYSRPLIKCYGSGSGTLNVNGAIITLDSINSYVMIDSRLLEAYTASVNMNSHMVGEFPIFNTGKNYVSFSGGITKLEIETRWRYV